MVTKYYGTNHEPLYYKHMGLWDQSATPLTQPWPTQAHSGHTHVFQDFASEGLRTLMVAYRELDSSFFCAWSKRHSEACLSLENRESKISSVYEEIEKDLMVGVKNQGQPGDRQSADEMKPGV